MMAFEPQHLKNAPIVEAMIAFDFIVAEGELGQIRRSFIEQIQVDYPTQKPIQKAEVTFNPEGSTGKTSEVGSRCVSTDGKKVCLISEQTFICSRLHPYENWESLRSEFQRLWEVFASFGKVQVTKVAVRYINKIFLPEGSEIFDSVFTYPKIADGLPQNTFNVFVRLQIAIPEPQGTLIVTEAQLPPEKPQFVAIALDHDLQFPVTEDTADIWALLEKARELKNEYFFASISEDLMKEYL
jgi:uncharacterized protein (TIGR04255 family)